MSMQYLQQFQSSIYKFPFYMSMKCLLRMEVISLCIVDASKTRIFVSFFERSFHPLHLRVYITNKIQIITYFNRLPPVDNVYVVVLHTLHTGTYKLL
jgi:hypothetical protein